MKTLTLTDDESIVLEELVGKALCGYTDEQTASADIIDWFPTEK